MMLLLWGMALLPVGLGMVWWGLKQVKASQAIKALGVKPLNMLQGGVQAMSGRLLAVEETLETPLATRNVVFYRAILERWISGKNGGRWAQWGEEVKTVPTLLDDASGAVVEVRLHAIKPNLRQDVAARAGGAVFSKPDPRVAAFAERLGKDPNGLFGTQRRLRVREFSLQHGESVHVSGWVDFQQAEWPVVSARGKDTPFRLTDRGFSGLYRRQLWNGIALISVGAILDLVGTFLLLVHLLELG